MEGRFGKGCGGCGGGWGGWGGLSRDDVVDTRGYVPGQCECDRSSSTLKSAH